MSEALPFPCPATTLGAKTSNSSWSGLSLLSLLHCFTSAQTVNGLCWSSDHVLLPQPKHHHALSGTHLRSLADGRTHVQVSMSKWHYKETACVQESHKQPLYCAAFNFHSPHLADTFATVGSKRATVYKCHPDGSLEVLQVFVDASADEEYFVVKWSVDTETGAPLLLLAGKRALLHVINCATGTLEVSLEGHGQPINDIAVHPTHPEWVVTASKDNSLRLWNIKTKVCVLVFVGEGSHRNEVLSVDWKAGDEDMLASAGMDDYIMIWALKEHRPLMEKSSAWRLNERSFPTLHVTVPLFSTERVHWNYVDCVRWVGDLVLSKSVDNRIIAWRPLYPRNQFVKEEDVEYVQELTLEETKDIWWLRFSLDAAANVLAIGTNSGKVLLYDPHSLQPKPFAKLRRTGRKPEVLVRQTAVSFDGSIVIAAHEDGSITRYDRMPGSSRPGSAAGSGCGGSGGGGDVGDDESSDEEED